MAYKKEVRLCKLAHDSRDKRDDLETAAHSVVLLTIEYRFDRWIRTVVRAKKCRPVSEGSILFCTHSYDLCEDFGRKVEEGARSRGVRRSSSVIDRVSYVVTSGQI